MSILKIGDTIGIVACSNGLDEQNKPKIKELEKTLNFMGLNVLVSENIYKKKFIFNGTGMERAEGLMKFFCDTRVKAIFDISGGDLCNEILDYLDYEKIKANKKPFFGYSDLSVVINALYAKSNIESYLYQIRNLVYDYREEQIRRFEKSILGEEKYLEDFSYSWIQGNCIEGKVVGGNIRCLLKLAGTEYMPDFNDKVLFLESFGGDSAKMVTYLTQYKQLGVFDKINGIILGTFTKMEDEMIEPNIVELVKSIVNNDIPIAKTNEIGHGKDSKAIRIGNFIKLRR